jgi:iron complex outermembrane receptor protein
VASVSAKLGYLRSDTDGWVDNPGSSRDFGKKRQEGIRAALRWRPADSLLVDYVYDHSDQDGVSMYEQRQYLFPLFPFVYPLQPDRVDHSWRPVDLPIEDDFTASGHALTIEWTLGASTSLKSISAYRELDTDQLHDTTEAFNLPAVNRHNSSQHQFSQELLLSGAISSPAIQYHLGGFYFTETGHQQEQSLANPFGLAFAFPYVPPTLADLGDREQRHGTVDRDLRRRELGTRDPRDRLTLNAGGRYSTDSRDAERRIEQADTDYGFDPSVTVDYRWTDDLHTYALCDGVSRGRIQPAELEPSPFGREADLVRARAQVAMDRQADAGEPGRVLADLRRHAARLHRPRDAAGLHAQCGRGEVRRCRRRIRVSADRRIEDFG